jgi:hypothetical protein
MVGSITKIVDAIRKAVTNYSEAHSKSVRKEDILELLCIYFVLVDASAEGQYLLDSVGEDPRLTLIRTPGADRPALVSEWYNIVCRQAQRLSKLGGRLLGQDSLAVFDPKLKSRLESIVGSKFQKVSSLASIGAGLFYFLWLGDPKDEQMTRDLILSMYPCRRRVSIDLETARLELVTLSDALEDFRVICTKLATNEEIVTISKKARRLTRLPSTAK